MDRVPVRPAAISCLTGKKLIGPVQRRGLFQEAPGFFLSKWYRCVRGKACLIDATVFFAVPESWFANTSISFGDVFFAKCLDFNQFSGLRFSFQECTLRCACWSDISFSVKLCICMLPKLVYRACVTVASSFAASDIQIPRFSRRMQPGRAVSAFIVPDGPCGWLNDEEFPKAILTVTLLRTRGKHMLRDAQTLGQLATCALTLCHNQLPKTPRRVMRSLAHFASGLCGTLRRQPQHSVLLWQSKINGSTLPCLSLCPCKLLVKDCCWGKMDRVPVRPAAISCLTGKKLIGPVQRRGLFQEAPGFFLSKWYRCVRGKTCLIDATVFFAVPESWFANTSISFGDVFFAKCLDFNQFSGLRFSFQECTLRCACWSDISFSVKLCICMLPKLVYRACVTVASSFAASDIQIPRFSRRMQMLNSRRGAVNSF